MPTLSQINQYAMDNNIGDDTDIFTILSQMQLEYKASTAIPAAPKTDYSIQDVLDLFST